MPTKEDLLRVPNPAPHDHPTGEMMGFHSSSCWCLWKHRPYASNATTRVGKVDGVLMTPRGEDTSNILLFQDLGWASFRSLMICDCSMALLSTYWLGQH
jgi:hypothetical protein